MSQGGVRFDGRPLWAEIDLDALEHNLTQLRGLIPPSCQICAVVKANAYGHGAVAVAGALQAAAVDRFGVATVDEAIQLRRAGITTPILLLGALQPREIGRAVEHDVTVTVDSRETVRLLGREAMGREAPLPVHIKVDTGMHRFGVSPEEAPALADIVERQQGLRLEGAWTHFADADAADKGFVRSQYEIFTQTLSRMPPVRVRHVANSAAVLDMPELALDMIRPGISLYGLYPSKEVHHDVELKPVLSLRAHLVRTHRVAPGDTVSYDRTWRAEEAGTIGLVPLGYADGFRRGLSNRGVMLVAGQRVPVAGRVTMDQTMVDVSGLPDLEAGAMVTIYGRDGDEAISVDDVAALEGTINYEITCALSARVPRVLVRSGAVERIHTLLGEQEPAGIASRIR